MDVGLGTWPTPVRGLLGNPENNPNLLEGRDGTRYVVPLKFGDVYAYGNTWRVASTASLLRPCSQVAAGNPTAPFFTADLNPSLRVQSENVCRRTRPAGRDLLPRPATERHRRQPATAATVLTGWLPRYPLTATRFAHGGPEWTTGPAVSSVLCMVRGQRVRTGQARFPV
ncbi:hypothetical protein [Amycolatopsis sp. cmx-11-12]|uniref:hypothetical protein n=1 Tax=Amycolatopsis sp. cmx-11-12 TaxID=2785795 RepID=UPI0039170F6F